jgi:hypothetical protein
MFNISMSRSLIGAVIISIYPSYRSIMILPFANVRQIDFLLYYMFCSRAHQQMLLWSLTSSVEEPSNFIVLRILELV